MFAESFAFTDEHVRSGPVVADSREYGSEHLE